MGSWSDTSSAGVKTFDLDFGRVAVLICYDINFIELWTQAEALGADLLLWSSAMATPDPTATAYARVFAYDVVEVGFPGAMIDRRGVPLNTTAGPAAWPMLKTAEINIDRTYVHWDNNHEKVASLLADHPEIVVDEEGPPFYVLRSTKPDTVSARKLVAQYKIETNRQYIQRSRRGLNLLRNYGAPPP
jgi:hypothetical protein